VPHQIKRNYQGELTFLSGPSAIDIILQTSQDSLLASMTTSEMGESRNIEALKAFAIVARSFLLAGPRHPSIHADLCDTTHCEVFQAFEPTPEAWSAVKETRDLVLTYKNAPFRTYYSRSCGGKTATYREVWGKESADYPFESVLCPCRNEWSTKLTFKQLQVAIGFPIVQIQQRENRVEFSGVHQTTSLSAEEFRTRIGRALGWNLVRSDWFVTSREDDGLLIQGKGSGHRVGFCQDGADVLALRKKTFLQILQYYFPHTEVRSHTNS